MKRYDDVVPNGAARLFEIFENETKHRRELELTTLKYQGRDLQQGKIYALIFSVLVLAVVIFCIIYDAPWVAAVFGGGLFGTIAFGLLRVFGDGQSKSTVAQRSQKTDTKRPTA